VVALGDLTARGVEVIGAVDGAVPDRELRAVGMANILSGLFQGFITGGGASQTAAYDRAGAQTQLVSLLVAGLTVVTAVALLPLFWDLPQAALGAVVINAVIGFLVIALVAMVAVLPWGCSRG
jgi:sulfate permease, SulP family